MLFNSLAFAAFLPTVFAIYWSLRGSLRWQNLFLLLSSYFFYGWWDRRFLLLILFSSLVDYGVGRGLGGEPRPSRRRALLGLSLAANLGLLGFFKYFNFFADSFADVLSLIGYEASWVTLRIVLPVGISFYTFQTLSYTIDVYRGKLAPTRDLVAFLTYVSFFPQLVAGPIERATALLPQVLSPRRFDEGQAIDGLRQVLWGLFKKVVVADNCGLVADDIFADYVSYSSASLLLGGFFFAMQIYGDFSGYSDVAIGTARLFGFRLMRNFAYPYFSRDIAEFWRRWHISLSSWFRDYVYIPLGGSRAGRSQALRNVVVIFLVSGFWHGANWTFLAWGALNAAYFIPLFLRGTNRENLDVVAQGRRLPSLRELLQVGITFLVTVVAWVFFRAPSVGGAFDYLARLLTAPPVHPLRLSTVALVSSLVMLAWEWLQREREHGLAVEGLPRWARWALYVAVILAILDYGGAQRAFIYFQF